MTSNLRGRHAFLALLIAIGFKIVASRDVAAQSVIEPKEAMSHLGEKVTVEGHVDSIVCSPMACLISFQTNFSGLVATIPGPAIARFPAAKETYSGKTVRVTGTVTAKNGRARIELTDPKSIELVLATGRTTVSSSSVQGGARSS